MDHHQILPVLALAEGCPPFLILAVLLIKDRERQRIAEHRGGEPEADLVVGEIAPGFDRVSIEMIRELGIVGHAVRGLLGSAVRKELTAR